MCHYYACGNGNGNAVKKKLQNLLRITCSSDCEGIRKGKSLCNFIGLGETSTRIAIEWDYAVDGLIGRSVGWLTSSLRCNGLGGCITKRYKDELRGK